MVPDLQKQHQSLLQDLRKKLLEFQTAGHKFDPMGWPTKMLQTEPRYDLQPPALFSDTKVYPCLAQLLIRLTGFSRYYQVNAFRRHMTCWLLFLFQHICEAIQKGHLLFSPCPGAGNKSI